MEESTCRVTALPLEENLSCMAHAPYSSIAVNLGERVAHLEAHIEDIFAKLTSLDDQTGRIDRRLRRLEIALYSLLGGSGILWGAYRLFLAMYEVTITPK